MLNELWTNNSEIAHWHGFIHSNAFLSVCSQLAFHIIRGSQQDQLFFLLIRLFSQFLQCEQGTHIDVANTAKVENNFLLRNDRLHSVAICITIQEMKSKRTSHDTVIYISPLTCPPLSGSDRLFTSSIFFISTHHQHATSLRFRAYNTQTNKNRSEEATPPISPASVPIVIVKTRQTKKAQKSAHDVRQSGFSSENWAKREKRFTITMAARDALGM